MHITAHLVLLVLALICMGISALNLVTPKNPPRAIDSINWFSAAWAFVIASLIW